jgi:hypothetical protein
VYRLQALKAGHRNLPSNTIELAENRDAEFETWTWLPDAEAVTEDQKAVGKFGLAGKWK